MTDDKVKFKHENGKRCNALIDSVPTVVGFNVVLGQASVAFVPPTRWRPKVGESFPLDDENFLVRAVRVSSMVPHMIVVDLDPVEKARG
jgi:hypothetical protein